MVLFENGARCLSLIVLFSVISHLQMRGTDETFNLPQTPSRADVDPPRVCARDGRALLNMTKSGLWVSSFIFEFVLKIINIV